MVAAKLVTALLKNDNNNIVSNLMKKLNNFLENDKVGIIFQLIDCMHLLGISSLYIGRNE